MKEETKEEYLARMKRERGFIELPEELNELPEETSGLKNRLKTGFYLLLLAVFFYTVLQIFGMLKSN